MGQTKQGAEIVATKRIGITVEEYRININAGLKRCSNCRKWIAIELFSKDLSRHDRLCSACRECRKDKYKNTYIKKGRTSTKGRKYAKTRDGDKKQARATVNHSVNNKIIPNPNTLPCHECGNIHKAGDIRHEYHHHNGYNVKSHEEVVPLCSKCHHLKH